MKKTIVILLLLAMIYSLAACQSAPPVIEPDFSNQAEAEKAMKEALLIKCDYYRSEHDPEGLTADDLTVRYYGAYGGKHVGFIDGTPGPCLDWVGVESYMDVPFLFWDMQRLMVWYEGEIHSLEQASEMGLFTKAEMEAVGEYHKALNPELYELYSSWIPPIGYLKPQKAELALKKAYYEQNKAYIEEYCQENGVTFTFDDFEVRYYGAYWVNHVGYVDGMPGVTYKAEKAKETYMGYDFIYHTTQRLMVYRQGELLELKDAVKKGWFTKEEMDELYFAYKRKHKYWYPTEEPEK